jgi:hypothetical protein
MSLHRYQRRKCFRAGEALRSGVGVAARWAEVLVSRRALVSAPRASSRALVATQTRVKQRGGMRNILTMVMVLSHCSAQVGDVMASE